ncbi:hypothetical protein BDQ94DRAFT_132225 [Aspergillus welwitschiae]|uniref:Uncharacterized protein n=1 Tax=Aspergillus welwitschiae TaxID=1341132 RepID=A0A3F3QIE6_9EURO|nr:hypothetical protein BDQ94DRAFT_132225 [Aspergillus welwitschiae]RDH39033.1 hypothetical protein BDQ94DRAFT_132225 [Aspergillus welwitschiae]
MGVNRYFVCVSVSFGPPDHKGKGKGAWKAWRTRRFCPNVGCWRAGFTIVSREIFDNKNIITARPQHFCILHTVN